MNTLRASRLLRLAMLPVAVLCLFGIWWNFGSLRVPLDMRSMGADYPPGAMCVIHKRPGLLQAGQVVFFRDDDAIVLSRVRTASDDWFTVAHDTPTPHLGDGSQFGRVSHSRLLGVVLTTLKASGSAADHR